MKQHQEENETKILIRSKIKKALCQVNQSEQN